MDDRAWVVHRENVGGEYYRLRLRPARPFAARPGQFAMVNSQDRVGLVALDSTTGAVRGNFVNDLSGGVGVNGALTVQALTLTHDLSRLVVVHTGRKIAGDAEARKDILDGIWKFPEAQPVTVGSK